LGPTIRQSGGLGCAQAQSELDGASGEFERPAADLGRPARLWPDSVRKGASPPDAGPQPDLDVADLERRSVDVDEVIVLKASKHGEETDIGGL